MNTTSFQKVAQVVVTVIRDLVSMGVGAYGILHQTVTDHVNPALLTVYCAMIGGPGLLALRQLVRGSPEPPSTVTPSSASPLPSSLDS